MQPHRSALLSHRVLLAIVGAGLLMGAGRLSAAVPPKESKESISDAAAIERKLDKILETQEQIQKQLDTLTEEIRVVKVRCTR